MDRKLNPDKIYKSISNARTMFRKGQFSGDEGWYREAKRMLINETRKVEGSTDSHYMLIMFLSGMFSANVDDPKFNEVINFMATIIIF